MTPERLLLDTDVVIDLLKKQPMAVERFLALVEAKTSFLLSLEDYLLATSARMHRCPLWTGNRKHYPMSDIELFAAG